jgi:hypothetical protein
MKVSLNFSNVKDTDLSQKFIGIGQKMKTNIWLFPKTPVDLDDFISLVGDLGGAITAALDGSKKAISQRNKLRDQAVKMATQLGHYVDYVSGNELEIVYASGFVPANKYRRLPQPLPKSGINKVVRGPNSGTALAYIAPISRSNGKVKYYELRFAAKNGGDAGEFTVITKLAARFPIAVVGLIPGTTYIFQARATSIVGSNDWCDPVSFMAT